MANAGNASRGRPLLWESSLPLARKDKECSMDYQEIYKSKLTDIDGALSVIRDGDKVVSGGVGVEPAA